MNHDEIMRGFCAVLDSCQTRPRSELLGQHTTMLERLCRHARKTTPFYATRLDPLFDAHDRFTLEGWSHVPPLTREEVQTHFTALKSKDVPENFGAVAMAQSPGVTGTPVQTLWTDTQQLATQCVLRRLYQWQGANPSTTLVRIAPQPMVSGLRELEDSHWSAVHKALDEPGHLITLNSQLPAIQMMERLEEIKPDHIAATPRQMLAIANAYAARQAEPSYQLKTMRAYGEVRSPALDARLEATFGAAPLANYTVQEVGHIALQCPDCGAYHVVDEVMHVDVVDAAHQPVAANAIGEVLATPLYSYAMPLIRYAVGDEARVGATQCHNAQTVDLAEMIGPRSEQFTHPDGGRFRPARGLLTQLEAKLGAATVQLVQQEPTRYTLRYQAESIPAKEALKDAQRTVEETFGFKLSLSLERVASMPTDAQGKRQDFICAMNR